MSTSIDIILVLDESGSMAQMENEPINAVNAFLAEQKKIDTDSRFTMYTFNRRHEKVYNEVPLRNVRPFAVYNPEDVTALYDCLGTAIEDKMRTPHTKNVVLVIVTDGQDNCSERFTVEQIKDLITKQEQEHGWRVIYLAANQDAFAVGTDLGISPQRTSNFHQHGGGLLSAMTSAGASLSQYRQGAGDVVLSQATTVEGSMDCTQP